MEDRHFSEDELLDLLYGVSSRADSHIDRCFDCRLRWESLTKARSLELAKLQPDFPETLLRKQRESVKAAIDRRATKYWLPGPIPALALAMLCAIAILICRPKPQPVEISDAQFFAEIYSVAEANEPQSAAPIQNLFQGEQSK